MNGLTGLSTLVGWWKSHGTKILGTANSIILALIAVPKLIPPDSLPYWAGAGAVLGVLTFKRGFTNSTQGPTP